MACRDPLEDTHVKPSGNFLLALGGGGGAPKTIQCGFDHKFIGGKAAALLRPHGTRIQAAPPNWQDKNGMVE